MSSPSSKGPRQIPLIRPCEVSDLAALERIAKKMVGTQSIWHINVHTTQHRCALWFRKLAQTSTGDREHRDSITEIDETLLRLWRRTKGETSLKKEGEKTKEEKKKPRDTKD